MTQKQIQALKDNQRMTSEESEIRLPQSKTELFVAFTQMALQGVGGVLVIVQHELVNRRKWLTQAQFVEEWSVAQVMPGPNVVNLCLILGGKYFGVAGALAAVSGLILAPMPLRAPCATALSDTPPNKMAKVKTNSIGAKIRPLTAANAPATPKYFLSLIHI